MNVVGVPTARGRPLSAAVQRAVFDEVLRLVEITPASGLTRRAVAEGAGVSRQTLYNRWATTADIVLDALLDRADRSIGVSPDGGLEAYLAELASAVDGWARPGLRAIAAFAQSDERFAARFRDEFLAVRHAALERAVGADGAARRPAELIAASMWYRVLIVDVELDRSWIDEMVALASS